MRGAFQRPAAGTMGTAGVRGYGYPYSGCAPAITR
jgi:hypothetical protein